MQLNSKLDNLWLNAYALWNSLLIFGCFNHLLNCRFLVNIYAVPHLLFYYALGMIICFMKLKKKREKIVLLLVFLETIYSIYKFICEAFDF